MIDIIGYSERIDIFVEREDWPNGMIIWNIGRQNFRHKGWLPLCFVDDEHKVDLKRLVALNVGDEELCLKVFEEAVCRRVDNKKFEEIKADHYSRKRIRYGIGIRNTKSIR